MARIKQTDLQDFCKQALIKEGMNQKNADTCARVLAMTDALGTHSHGTKNLHGYIKKMRVGGAAIDAEPEIVAESSAVAVVDGHQALGMISACFGMELACRKAKENGVALVTVKNSCHFGAAGYYANIAALDGLIGISMSNVDPNMTVPGAKGMLIGNNPFAYAVPGKETPSVFLDIAMSNVASLKVVQARKNGDKIPNTWIVDKDGLPTDDPSHYPEEGAMQPMAAHKGYGLAMMVELLSGVLSGGGVSVMGDIVSWCFDMEKPNNVCHTFIAIDPDKFIGKDALKERMDGVAESIHGAEKAKGKDRIYLPGEIEWTKFKDSQENGILLPEAVLESLTGLSHESGIPLKVLD